MGLELFVLMFTLAAATTGLVLPIVGWAVYSNASQRRLVEVLGTSCTVESIVLGDALAPLKVHLLIGSRRVEVLAHTRGTTDLWRLDVHPSTPIPVGTLALVDRRWAHAMKSSRALPRVECDAIPLSMALHADVPERSLALLSRPDVKQAVGAFFGLGDSCIAVEITDEGVSTTLVRQGMSGDQALACLERVLALADAVFGPDDTRPRSLRSRPPTRAVGDGQSPVAVPSALGSSGR